MSRRHLVLIAFASLLVVGCKKNGICPDDVISCGQLCDDASAPSGCGDTCDMSTPCPAGLYCGADGTCTADCADDGDAFCPNDACTADGQCVASGDICPDGSISCGQACEDVADAGAGNNLCGAACTADGDCAGGYYCSDEDTCTQDCSASNDEFCPADECDSNGRCVPGDDTDGGDVCARQSVESTRVTPNVVFIIDRSGSMAWELDLTTCHNGGCNPAGVDCPLDDGDYDCYTANEEELSRWVGLRTALVGTDTGVSTAGLIGEMQDQVRFGAALYRRSGSGNCYLMNNLTPVDVSMTEHIGVVDVGAATLARETIAGDGSDGQYLDLDPGGGTPTGAAVDWTLDNIDPSLLVSGDPTIFILATDGEPTDDSDCDSHTYYNSDPEAWSVAAVGRAYSAGIRTFVLAVADPSQLPDAHVDDLANAGVGAASGADWWRVQSATELSNALDTIIQGEISCTVDLQGQVTDWAVDPCSDGSVTIVQDGGNRIPVSCDATNGWILIAEDQLRLNGTSCDTLKASAGATLDASFPCGTVFTPP